LPFHRLAEHAARTRGFSPQGRKETVMGKQTKVGSGGNGKAVAIGVATGSPKVSAISPGAPMAKPAAVPLGNAQTMGTGGPGKGRTVHGPGSQGRH